MYLQGSYKERVDSLNYVPINQNKGVLKLPGIIQKVDNRIDNKEYLSTNIK